MSDNSTISRIAKAGAADKDPSNRMGLGLSGIAGSTVVGVIGFAHAQMGPGTIGLLVGLFLAHTHRRSS